ncbi:MAG TPA: nuclear transport factor 2 family protein [Acidimicrobiales bacterium]|nr:nuclear transport factor 2 family protein [Acidimicrobiales bacterium]
MGTLADREEITDVVSRLGACLDDGRFDDLRSLLAETTPVWASGTLPSGPRSAEAS